jgi:hypothetical protein
VYEDYGNLAGFAGFAGATDTSDVPVVRYQDLHRSHAPASAGAMAVYANPATARQGDFEENLDGYGDVAYGDVAYGEAHGAPPEFAGIQPLPIPTHVAAYGYAGPKAYPTAADLDDYPELEYSLTPDGDEIDYIKAAQTRLIALGYLAAKKSNGQSNVDGVFGTDSRDATIRFQNAKKIWATGTVGPDTWFALYGLRAPTKTPSPTAAPGTTVPEAKKDDPFYRALFATTEAFGLKSGRDAAAQQPVAGAPAPTGTEIDWKKVALWGGVAVGGILLTVVIVKAVKD